jgi:hypothetical protein
MSAEEEADARKAEIASLIIKEPDVVPEVFSIRQVLN